MSQKILVTGANSYVGARLYVDLKKDFDVVGTYHNERLFSEFLRMDITDYSSVCSVMSEAAPDIVLHVAGNPNGRWCDANPEEGKRINETGTKNVVSTANKAGAKMIYMSSVAALNPFNVYARTKAAGEALAKSADAGYVILEPSLIIGLSPNTTNDRPFNRLLKNIREKTPAVYDTSWKFQPTYLGHISEVICAAVRNGVSGETIPISVPEFKTRYEIAKDILSPFGIHVEPKDDNDKTPVIEIGQDKLEELGMPRYTYKEITEKMIREIRDDFLHGKSRISL